MALALMPQPLELEKGPTNAEVLSPQRASSFSPPRQPCRRHHFFGLTAYASSGALTASGLLGWLGDPVALRGGPERTLVTPADWANGIWGAILVSEGCFALAQFSPRLRTNDSLVRMAAPWYAVCGFQALWAALLVKGYVATALPCALALLLSLGALLFKVPAMPIGSVEYWLLRAPFSLHAGWVLALACVNANAVAASAKASPETLLALAIGSLVLLFTAAAFSAVATPRPDPPIPLAAAWALAGIFGQLEEARAGRGSPARFAGDHVVIGGVSAAALGLCLAAVGLTALACAVKARAWSGSAGGPLKAPWSVDDGAAAASRGGQGAGGGGAGDAAGGFGAGPNRARLLQLDQEAAASSAQGGGGGPGRPALGRRIDTSTALAAIMVVLMLLEIIILSRKSVPWVLDKVFWILCLALQVVMASFWPLQHCASERCRSMLMDFCHWSFVVMVFGGGIFLRSNLSLLVVAMLALLTVCLRLAMGNVCIITAVAETSSLPNISGETVNAVFGSLLVATAARLLLAFLFGEGWPVTQFFQLLGLV